MKTLISQINYQIPTTIENTRTQHVTITTRKTTNNPTLTTHLTPPIKITKTGTQQIGIILIDHTNNIFITGAITLKLNYNNPEPLKITNIKINTPPQQNPNLIIQTIHQLTTTLKIKNKQVTLANHTKIYYDNQIKKLIKYQKETK